MWAYDIGAVRHVMTPTCMPTRPTVALQHPNTKQSLHFIRITHVSSNVQSTVSPVKQGSLTSTIKLVHVCKDRGDPSCHPAPASSLGHTRNCGIQKSIHARRMCATVKGEGSGKKGGDDRRGQQKGKKRRRGKKRRGKKEKSGQSSNHAERAEEPAHQRATP